MKEQRVGIRELKSSLSSVLRRVKAGDAVLITERGKPVGRIVPADESIAEALEAGSRKQLWAWSGRKWQPVPQTSRPRRGMLVSDLLLDDRE